MNKKGQFSVARKSIYWMIAVSVITLVVLGFFWMLASYQSSLTAIDPEVRAELISLRFVNSPECFTYVDEKTGKALLREIDLEKFTEERLQNCYAAEKENYNFKLVLEEEGQEITTENYFNKDDFTLFKKVKVRKAGEVKFDRMIIYVQENLR